LQSDGCIEILLIKIWLIAGTPTELRISSLGSKKLTVIHPLTVKSSFVLALAEFVNRSPGLIFRAKLAGILNRSR
jgi:hypothetical protein